MDVWTLIIALIGGSGIGGIISAFFNRKESKDTKEINLLDRAYVEITRLDVKITALEKLLLEQKTKNKEMEERIWQLRKKRDEWKRKAEELEKERND